jgi:carboxylesterase type B
MITVLLLFVLLRVEADDLVVSTTTGEVRGFWKDTACIAFLGIPYAKPPVGTKSSAWSAEVV